MTAARARILPGDCRRAMRLMAAMGQRVDVIVSDPPYHLASIVARFGGAKAAPAKAKQTGAYKRASTGFMGQTWDGGDVAFDPETWRLAYDLLPPGGHLAAFSGTRTYHRMACAIEDAGFEIRDQLGWAYGTGFPKSHNVAHGIQKLRDDRSDILRVTAWIRGARDAARLSNGAIDRAFGFNGMAGHWTSAATQPAVPTLDQIGPLLALLGVTPPEDVRRLIWDLNGQKGQPGADWLNADVIGRGRGIRANGAGGVFESVGADATYQKEYDVRRLSPRAADWDGYGTALKPAWEPICLARKPIDAACGSVARNVLAHGAGALNIDGCKLDADPYLGGAYHIKRFAPGADVNANGAWKQDVAFDGVQDSRRWPANILHDGALDAVAGDGARVFYTAKADRTERWGWSAALGRAVRADDPALAGLAERPTFHPTVKPTDLMRWLCRLTTPNPANASRRPLVFDPFMGSGSTLVAALAEGFDAIGAELSPEYRAIASARLAEAQGLAPAPETAGGQREMFT